MADDRRGLPTVGGCTQVCHSLHPQLATGSENKSKMMAGSAIANREL